MKNLREQDIQRHSGLMSMKFLKVPFHLSFAVPARTFIKGQASANARKKVILNIGTAPPAPDMFVKFAGKQRSDGGSMQQDGSTL